MLYKILLSVLIGYLVGSIPWALIIGKTFYHKDIRQYGSGNLGGTNACRVLGKKVGILIMILDASKAFLLMTILRLIDPSIIRYAGLAVCIGHCFPIFAGFKGGKAVACSCGYVLGICLYITHNVLLGFILPMLIWLIVLLAFRYMSVASMSGLIAAAIMGFITYHDFSLAIMVFFLALFVIFMHRSNIIKLIKGQEKKVNL